MKLKFSGKEYRGMDGDRSVRAVTGQEIEVSDAKASQLLKDFPKDWAKPGQEAAKVKLPVDPTVQAKVDAEVAKLRAEVNQKPIEEKKAEAPKPSKPAPKAKPARKVVAVRRK